MTQTEVTTDHGTVIVSWDENSVTVSIETPNEKPTEVTQEERPESMSMTVRFGGRAPHKGDEVTQNGSTFEVIGVRRNGDGYDVLNGNTETWEKWVER